MFYEVKILNPKGKVKKVVSPSQLSKRYWNDFYIKLNPARDEKSRRKQRSSIGKCA
ncbi:MAG: hypothetical protein NPINA01_25370 [Nitrospinaceae bacterium]|nr:MAG: hypothetical protein NPINA01_25370 [Nitrospinaceae bacterium]